MRRDRRARERLNARGRPQTSDVQIVLDRERQATQRAASLDWRGVDRARGRLGALEIESDDRVERGIVPRDAVRMDREQFRGGDLA